MHLHAEHRVGIQSASMDADWMPTGWELDAQVEHEPLSIWRRAATKRITGGRMSRVSEFVDSVSLFLACWAAWSLLDAYTLRFTPVSELVALACCALLRLAPVGYRWAHSRWVSGEEAVKQILERV